MQNNIISSSGSRFKRDKPQVPVATESIRTKNIQETQARVNLSLTVEDFKCLCQTNKEFKEAVSQASPYSGFGLK